MRLRVLAIAAFVLSASVAARADQIFTFNNATFSSSPGGAANDGTLSGMFTTNDAMTAVLSYDITASAAGSFTGFEYTTSDSSVSAETLPPQYFQIDSTGSVDELRIYLTSSLTSSGAVISPAFSYEHEPSGGNRFPSGSIGADIPAAAPEPSSLALAATGLLGVAGALRRRLPR